MRIAIAVLIMAGLAFGASAQPVTARHNCAPHVAMPNGPLRWTWELAAQHPGRYAGQNALRCVYTPMGRDITDIPAKRVNEGCALFVTAANANGVSQDWALAAMKYGTRAGRTVLRCIYHKTENRAEAN